MVERHMWRRLEDSASKLAHSIRFATEHARGSRSRQRVECGGLPAVSQCNRFANQAVMVTASGKPLKRLDARCVCWPASYAFSGVRPSAGAETGQPPAGQRISSALHDAELAAPEDGRTPLNAYIATPRC